MTLLRSAAFAAALAAGSVAALAQAAAQARIGVSTGRLDAFLSALSDGIATAAAARGAALTQRDAGGDPEAQLEQVRELLAADLDVVIVAPLDGDDGAAMTEAARLAGKPLVFVNGTPANLEDLPPDQAFVGSDERDSGTIQTAEVCRILGGKGRILVLMGELTHPAARRRTEDVDDVLARPDCAGMEVLERKSAIWNREFARLTMHEWLDANLRFEAVIANNDEMALGALAAMEKAGIAPETVVVAGIDATPDALEAMRAGALDVTVLQDAAGQGETAVRVALDLAAGRPAPRLNWVPFRLVTRETMP